MAEKAPMTRQGYEALVNELKHLRAVVRPQVIEAVRLAR
jgi:transcription elongation GreA/GreB family factor